MSDRLLPPGNIFDTMAKRTHSDLSGGIGVFGDYIRNRRRYLSLTLHDIHRLTGISASYLSGIERGERPAPNREQIVSLAQALRADPDFLLQLAGYGPTHLQETLRPYGLSWDEWLEAQTLLPPQEWEEIVALIRKKVTGYRSRL